MKYILFIISFLLLWIFIGLYLTYKHVDSKVTTEGLKLLSTDFHISPIADIKHFLSKYGVEVVDESLSGHCHLTDTCSHNLQILSSGNGMTLGDCPLDLRKRFYDYYSTSEFMAQIDGIICTHASSLCELFMPFGKPMMIISSTRYDIGRFDRHNPSRLKEWNDNLLRIAKRTDLNTIAANNVYDLNYMNYFTGLSPLYLPSTASYIEEVFYCPTVPTFLLGPSRNAHPGLSHEIIERTFDNEITVETIRSRYRHYSFQQLSSHFGVVLVPYQVSLMSFFEYYRMGIPIFVPSLSFLVKLHSDPQIRLLDELTWDLVFEHKVYNSSYLRQSARSKGFLHDPNDQIHSDALKEWLQFADYYQFPYLFEFSSVRELIDLLRSFSCLDDKSECVLPKEVLLGCSVQATKSFLIHRKLAQTSIQMRNYLKSMESRNDKVWIEFLQKVRASKERKTNNLKSNTLDFAQALKLYYDVEINKVC